MSRPSDILGTAKAQEVVCYCEQRGDTYSRLMKPYKDKCSRVAVSKPILIWHCFADFPGNVAEQILHESIAKGRDQKGSCQPVI